LREGAADEAIHPHTQSKTHYGLPRAVAGARNDDVGSKASALTGEQAQPTSELRLSH
jgi:hypothetical protein